MLVQNVQTDVKSGPGIFSFYTGKNATKSDVFANLFNNMTGNAATVQKVSASQNDVKKQDIVQKDDSSKNVFAQNDKTNTLTSEKGKDLKATTGNTNSGSKNVKTETTEMSAEDIEKVSAALAEITTFISEFFEISEEGLQNLMEKSGFELKDLADPEKLQSLFVELKLNGDETQLLTDGDALESLNEFLEVTSEVIEKKEVPEEKFAEILKQFTETPDKKTDITGNNDDEKKVRAENKTELISTDKNSTVVDNAETNSDKKAGNENGFDRSSESEKDKSFSVTKKTKTTEGFTARFVNHMFESVRNNVTDVEELGQVARIRTIANQILTMVKANVTPETTSLEIRLSPAHLGKVNVVIEESNGVLTAKFQTDNRIAKEAIENSLPQFKETLREQGIKVENVEVSVSDFSFDKNKESADSNAEEHKNNNKRHFSLDEINEKVDGNSELQERVFLENGTSTVNYVA